MAHRAPRYSSQVSRVARSIIHECLELIFPAIITARMDGKVAATHARYCNHVIEGPQTVEIMHAIDRIVDVRTLRYRYSARYAEECVVPPQ
jgi:hypothetical protein